MKAIYLQGRRKQSQMNNKIMYPWTDNMSHELINDRWAALTQTNVTQ